MMLTVALLAILPAAFATKSCSKRWTQSSASCTDFYTDISATANNLDLASVLGPAPENEMAFVQSSIDLYTSGNTLMEMLAMAPPLLVSDNYTMWFEYCVPANGTAKGIFQTIHGVNGNAGYWNAIVDGKTDNSFVESAAAAGWATLSYDRLGVGRSAHPDGVQVVQSPYELAQAVTIGEMIRAGSFNNVPAYDTVVSIGHSYGSALVAGLTKVAPDLYNASVLTGFSANATTGPLGIAGFASVIANTAYPDRFANLSNAYLATPSVNADQQEFFHYPNFTADALTLFTTTKGEYTIGQINSVSEPPTMPSVGLYTAPTLVITGANDGPFCAGNCSSTSLGPGQNQLATTRPLFANVSESDFMTYVVPDTAHGINFHTTAYSAYQVILDFVTSHL